MIPVALPQHVAGAGLTRSLFLVPRTLDSTIHCVSSLSSINSINSSSTAIDIEAEYTLLLSLEQKGYKKDGEDT
jgi:hypothetical protein